jgi:hypothetical protein
MLVDAAIADPSPADTIVPFTVILIVHVPDPARSMPAEIA